MRWRSTGKVDVVIEEVAGKPCAKVKEPQTGRVLLVPSFEDLFRMTTAIVKCERLKFPTLPWEPADMVRRFHNRSIDAAVFMLNRDPGWPPPARLYEAVWARLASEFKLEIRDGGAQQILTPADWKLTAQDEQNARYWGLDVPKE